MSINGGGAMPPMAGLEDLQHWTSVIGRAQQMLIEYAAETVLRNADPKAESGGLPLPTAVPQPPADWIGEAEKFVEAQASLWTDGMKLWERMLAPMTGAATAEPSPADKDRRFSADAWKNNPVFDLMRQSYLMLADHLIKGVDSIEGVEPAQREQIRFATRAFVDALSPSNFAFTNPQVIERTVATRGDNLLKGLSRMLTDMRRGQLTHTDTSAFELGRNIAATPGKVIHQTRMYQLIQYAPATPEVDRIPLLIFPPWINRFYILDLNENNSFIRWAVAQGITVFVVSWKSADSSMADVTMEDYVLGGMVDAIDTVRDLLDVPSVNTIGYCVGGTTLAVTLAWLAANDQADKVNSATFFTAQVDFTRAGELKLLVDDQMLQVIDSLSEQNGYLDGRYMAATFNMLRGRDLIWNYVVNNYLMGDDYPAFDLLYWNGDTTNLPARWHADYLRDYYRDNKLVEPGAISIAGTPIDLRKIRTPAYVQAGRDDHIAPAASVWKITEHLRGPIRFLLAGSGHIAGVVNPPSANKYQYWTNDAEVGTFDAFVAGATETKGSWWPHWRGWIGDLGGGAVPARGARIPGKGKLKAIEDAPGSYVKTR